MVRVVPVRQSSEVGEAGIEAAEVERTGEHLGPVRAGLVGRQRSFDLAEKGGDCRRVRPPGEVNAEGWTSVGGAQPQIVRGHGPNLATLRHLGNLRPQFTKRPNGAGRVATIQQILRLDFRTGARVVPQQEVGQPVTPRPRFSELRSAVQGIVARGHVQLLGCRSRAEQCCQASAAARR